MKWLLQAPGLFLQFIAVVGFKIKKVTKFVFETSSAVVERGVKEQHL